MRNLRELFQKHSHLMAYLFFGALTTAVNYAVYLPCYNLLGMTATVSNVIAWAAAVVFAYLTNKLFVFKNHDWSKNTVIPEFAKFVGCRVGSGAIETVFLFLTVDVLQWSGNWMKLIIAVVVVIVNYIASKIVVFRK